MGRTSLVAQKVKHLPTVWETRVQSLGREDLLKKEMATHSSILAWKIPRMEEPDRLQFMGSQRVKKKKKLPLTVSIISTSICREVMGLDAVISSDNGILQARLLDWGAIPSSRESS